MNSFVPLLPLLVVAAGIYKLHVEQWRKYEGQQSYSGGPNQVQN